MFVESSPTPAPASAASAPAPSATPALTSSAAPKKRKRAAARKGWKGWEVEVDEEVVAPKQFSMPILPSGERRTRSGKQFDG